MDAPENPESPASSEKPLQREKFTFKLNLGGGTVLSFVRRHWGIIAVLIIVALATNVRLLDYHWPYLRNIDSYDTYRNVDQIVSNGGSYPGSDPLMLAPDGAVKNPGFYGYFLAYSYFLFNGFMPAMQLWQFLVWYPPLLASLSAIPAYFITKKLYDKRAGVIAALLMVFDPSMISRTLGGDPAHDGTNLLFSLIVLMAFFYSQDYVSRKGLGRNGVLYSLLLGILTIVWVSTLWGGYWLVVAIMTGFIALKLLIETAREHDFKKILSAQRHNLISFAIAMAFTIVIATVFIDANFLNGLFSSVSSSFTFGNIKSEAGTFPNVYVSVAELQNPGSLNDVIRTLGLPFFTTVVSIVYLGYSYLKTKKHLDAFVLFALWFTGLMTAVMVAFRFAVYLSVPMSLCTAILLSKVIKITLGEEKSLAE